MLNSILRSKRIHSLLIKQSRCISSTNKSSPLEGIRILDLTRIVAGPFCTMLLGDLGAEVIKIEQPVTGDEARNWGPFIENTSISSYFISLNRNKKSVCVDLKSSSGRVIVEELAKECDILVENFVPGKLDSLGLGFHDLSKIAPHLIYCSITGYGQKGPYKFRPGVDVIAASCGGLLHLTGPSDGDPCKTGVPITDIATGVYAYGAIMTALFQRERTGEGQKIDCNLLSTQISCLINIASAYLNANKEMQRLGSAHASIVPYQTFRTADGYITICAINNHQFTDMCKVLRLDFLLTDNRYATNSLRVQNRKSLVKILANRLLSKSTKDWLKILRSSSFPNGAVNTVSEVFQDEHVKDIEIVKNMMIGFGDVNNKDSSFTEIKVIGPAVEFSKCDNKVRTSPPALGQHTIHVLKHVLNYSDEQVEALMKNGAIS